MPKLTFLSVLCLWQVAFTALNAQVSVLEVNRRDQSRVQVELSNLSKITFSGSNVHFNLKSGEVTTMPTSEVRNLVFGTVTAVHTPSVARPMALSPNPVVDILHLTHVPSNVQTIAIYALSGQLMQQIPVSASTQSISVEHLRSGIYFIRAGSEVLKFLKQ